jgi:hypothetical protein
MRTLSLAEIDNVSGGDPVSDLVPAFRTGVELGSSIYSSLSEDVQNAIGGTIDAALVNTGAKAEPEDVPIQDTEGTEK